MQKTLKCNSFFIRRVGGTPLGQLPEDSQGFCMSCRILFSSFCCFLSWPHDSLESILYSGIRLAFCTSYAGMAASMSSGLYTACPRTCTMSRKMKPDECLQRPGSETRILILMPKPKNNPSPERRISQSSHQLRNCLLFSHSPGLFSHSPMPPSFKPICTSWRQDQMLNFSVSKLETLLGKGSPSFIEGQHIFLENCNFGS